MDRTFEYTQVDAHDLGHTDLRHAAIGGCIHDPVDAEDGTVIKPFGTTMTCLSGVVKRGDQTYANTAEGVVLYADGGYRIGLAWGGDATWGDLRTDAKGNGEPAFWEAVEAAVGDWLNDANAWEARN